jgi:hypothetical protein
VRQCAERRLMRDRAHFHCPGLKIGVLEREKGDFNKKSKILNMGRTFDGCTARGEDWCFDTATKPHILTQY